MSVLAIVLDVVTGALVVHCAINAALLARVPRGAVVTERVSILLPVRDEVVNVQRSLPALLAQRGLGNVEVIVCDDGSSDGTAEAVRTVAGDGARLVGAPPLPAGWLGKPHACATLAETAQGDVFVFVDADVVLTPDAVAAAVALMRSTGWQFVSPYPRQEARTWLERLAQPLLTWSWLTFLPLRLSASSSRPSLVAANGQFLVVDAAAYRRAGGHAAVRDDVVDDVALARRLRSIGATGGFADGSAVATCRMYDGARALVDGYAKSLWIAFGSPAAAVGVVAGVTMLWVVPWLLLIATPLAWPAAVAGPVTRLVAAVRTGNRPVVDALAHPLSVLAFGALVVVSLRRRATGSLSWKSRSLS